MHCEPVEIYTDNLMVYIFKTLFCAIKSCFMLFFKFEGIQKNDNKLTWKINFMFINLFKEKKCSFNCNLKRLLEKSSM